VWSEEVPGPGVRLPEMHQHGTPCMRAGVAGRRARVADAEAARSSVAGGARCAVAEIARGAFARDAPGAGAGVELFAVR